MSILVDVKFKQSRHNPINYEALETYATCENITMSEAARRCNISPRTIMEHFSRRGIPVPRTRMI